MLPGEEKAGHRDHLEKLVEERTAELKALNWHLQQQITERKQAEQALERASKDLQLLNLVNNAANQGYSLTKILQLVVQETKKMFSCNGATFYEISEDKKYLVMQNLNLSQAVAHQIEKLIRRNIPKVRIRLREGSLYWKALQAGKPRLINDPETIQGLMAECTARKLLKKLVPRIHQLLGIASVMQVPLISEGEVIGLVDISRKRPFTASELERFATIARQLLLIIERKQAEEALKQSEEKYRAVFEQASDAIILIDSETAETVDFNKKTHEDLGYSRDEFAKLKMTDIDLSMTPEFLMRHKEKMRKEGMDAFEAKQRTKSGEVRDVYVKARVFNIGGRSLVVNIWRDITERKKAEETLQAEKNKLQSVIDAIEYGITIIDTNYNIVYQNEHFQRVIGNQEGEKCYRAYVGRDKVCDECPVEQAFRDGKPHTAERRIVTSSGEIAFWEHAANPIRDAEGRIISCLQLTRDITERKLAEEKRQTILKTALDGFWLVNLEGKLLEVNDSCCKMVGYTREEMLEMSIPDLEAVETPEEIAQHIKKIVAQGYDRFETRHKCKDGRIIDVEMSINYLDMGEGQFFVFARDITQRKQAEEVVRGSEEKLRKMFESVTDGISVIDLNGIITEVNQRTVEMHGFSSKEELVGRNAFELVAPADHERVAANMRKALTQGVIKGVEYTLLKADGSEFPGELSTSVLKDASGKAVGHITISRDITERKQAAEREEELLHDLYLASRLAAVGELAAGVAHEMNNPLTGIMGFSERLLRKSDNDSTKKDLEIIHNEAQRLAKVVKNLLTFARRREPAKEYADINDIVQKTLELRAYELKSSNIEVALDLAAGLPQIMVDFHQIQEVFLNIILNAEQVMTEASGGGRLTIKTRPIKDYVRVSFTDDGPGIPAEYLDRVFNPFFTTKGERGGTGLGLSVCHGIVTDHGGRIYARSKPGSGATFLVDLPLTSRKIGESQIVQEQLAL